MPLAAENVTLPEGGVDLPMPASATWAVHVEPGPLTTIVQTTAVNVGFFAGGGAPLPAPPVISYSAFGAITYPMHAPAALIATHGWVTHVGWT